MTTEREALQQIRDIANAALGGHLAAGGSVSSSEGLTLPAITTKPDAIATLEIGGDVRQRVVSAGEVVGLDFEVSKDAYPSALKWFGAGTDGNPFRRTSWAIFDSGGNRVMGMDNYLISGTLGWAVDAASLNMLGAGSYRLAVAVGHGGRLAFQGV